MTESRYKIIQLNQNVHTDQEEDDSDEEEDVSDNLDDDTVTIVPANDLHFPQKFSETSSNMQTPTAILTLILIYFTLSIGLTFYQRDFLKVRDQSVLSIHLLMIFQCIFTNFRVISNESS